MQNLLKELRKWIRKVTRGNSWEIKSRLRRDKGNDENCESIAQKFKESRRNGWEIVSQFNYESLFRNYWIPI